MNGTRYHRSEKVLGRGATSEVYLGMHDDGSLVALKSIKIPDLPSSPTSPSRRRAKVDEMEAVLREINVMSTLRHDHIVAYLGPGVVGDRLIIVTEYVSGGSLHGTLEAFQRIPIHSLKRYLGDILRGLEYLHSNGIVHRDIKPHNVLLMIDGQCKLTDFGTAAELSKITNTDVTGTPLYMAPEACRGLATKASDIWGVGIMTIELITGKIPYTAEQWGGGSFVPTRFIYMLGHDEALMPTIPTSLSATAADFVSKCLQRDQTMRPTAAALLSHEFLM